MPLEKNTSQIDWPTKDTNDARRINFIKKNLYQIRDNIYKLFDNYPKETREQLCIYIARFLFGISNAYQRMGNKYQDYNLVYDINKEKNENNISIAYNGESNSFIISVDFLTKIADIFEESKNIYVKGAGGIKSKIPLEDFMEIAGIEEAAHLMFFNEKGQYGKDILDNVDPDIEYFTSDMESRALLWKLAYIKRYFPQYYPDLKQMWTAVKKARATGS